MASKARTLISRIVTLCDAEERSAMKVAVIRNLCQRYLDPKFAENEDMIEYLLGTDDYWTDMIYEEMEKDDVMCLRQPTPTDDDEEEEEDPLDDEDE